VNGYLSGESSYKSVRVNNSLSANRTTDAWKFSVGGRYSTNTRTYELEDGTDKYTQESWSGTGLAVKSITDRFSLGASGEVGRDSYYNVA